MIMAVAIPEDPTIANLVKLGTSSFEDAVEVSEEATSEVVSSVEVASIDGDLLLSLLISTSALI